MTTNEKLVSELIKNAPKMEKAVLDKLLMLIDDLDTKGGVFTNATLSNTELLQMQDAIRQALKTSGYAKESEIFLQDLGKITINSNIVLNDEGYRFPEVALTDLEKKWQTLTSESLLNSGIRNEFEMPILKIINENISYGNSISEAKKTLQEFIAGGGDKTGKLQSYLTVTARDSIGQLQGQQMQAVAIANGYEGISYTGGLLTDSRGQCYRWIKELKGFIPKEQLQAEIDLAVKYGKEKKIVDGHKYGGMMPNTTVDNFFLKRGGFGCIHTASPKRKKPK